MQILITGGAGFIGTNLAIYFAQRQHTISLLDNFSRKGTKHNITFLKKTIPQLTILEGDVRDARFISKHLNRYDCVIHLAGQVAVTTSIQSPHEDFEINLLGTFTILEAIRKAKTKPLLIYSSTNKVYGKVKSTLKEKSKRYQSSSHPYGISEIEQLDFYSPYGCSKGGADQYVHDYARIYTIPTVVLRKSCIYGAHQFGLEDQGWVAHFVIQALRNRPITIYGNGKQVRDILFVDDLAKLYEAAINTPRCHGDVFNIGGGSTLTISLLELIELLEKRLKKKISYTTSVLRPGDQEYYVSDIRKAQKVLNWKPSIGIDKGIEKLIAWVETNLPVIEKLIP